ncbi:uncharacterized protein LOC112514045 [Cynara cardunculus var. scolymus]|uniref:Uncharacterized protein n=1 Tax=Cynara cardunculus var. scolymus TaxID=59895 RepID=A0A103XYJ5_CYNCS|nr:uncharacterized protein LOC112514045 [Cynara cardunculus var. scolymus]KVH99229.1 hypothetical protein Ccrd_022539 [Cynara cardunculus var. scolymus]
MAASACINNIGFSPDNFLDYSCISMPHQDNLSDLPDPDLDFEFRLEDPVIMLPADQLFSDGKLIPLQLPHQPATTVPSKPRRRVSVADPFLYSPKAPRCSSRWKQLLSFRKLYQNNNNNIAKPDDNANGATKSIKPFLQRGSKSPNDNLPLLKDTDNEPASRLSLSSSSSSHDPDELPRVSLDSERPATGKVVNPPRMRMVKVRTASSNDGRRCPAEASLRIDSPRMNSSGKIVFHSLERSSSSPSSLNGLKHRGMERSYSGNVRVNRVLNVPVCSVRKSGGVFGLPLFSSPQAQNQNQKREAGSNGGGSRKSKTSLG